MTTKLEAKQLHDLRQRTGLPITGYEISCIDFLRDTAKLEIF